MIKIITSKLAGFCAITNYPYIDYVKRRIRFKAQIKLQIIKVSLNQ